MELHLVEHIRTLRGGSQPRLMRASDGHLYVVKFQDNPQGSRVLANELLASRLAEEMGLPVPHAEIVRLSPELAEGLSFETPAGLRPVPPGLHLGSPLVLSPLQGRVYDILPHSYFAQLRNKDAFFGIFLFDLWTCNRDTRQAVYWKRSHEKKFTVSFIDHGHCFGGPGWDFKDLTTHVRCETMPPQNQVDYWCPRLASIKPTKVFRLVADIPAEWYFNDQGSLLAMIDKLLAKKDGFRKSIMGRFGRPKPCKTRRRNVDWLIQINSGLTMWALSSGMHLTRN